MDKGAESLSLFYATIDGIARKRNNNMFLWIVGIGVILVLLIALLQYWNYRKIAEIRKGHEKEVKMLVKKLGDQREPRTIEYLQPASNPQLNYYPIQSSYIQPDNRLSYLPSTSHQLGDQREPRTTSFAPPRIARPQISVPRGIYLADGSHHLLTTA